MNVGQRRRAQFEQEPVIGRTLLTRNSGSSTVPGPADPLAAAVAAFAGSMAPACAAALGEGVSPPTIRNRFGDGDASDNLHSPSHVVPKVSAGQPVDLASFLLGQRELVGRRFAPLDAAGERDRFRRGLRRLALLRGRGRRSARHISGRFPRAVRFAWLPPDKTADHRKRRVRPVRRSPRPRRPPVRPRPMIARTRPRALQSGRRRDRRAGSPRRRARGRRSDDTGEVERIGRADRQAAAVRRRAADFAQALDGVAKRELFPGHAGDEASATNFAARFEPSKHPRQVAPRRHVRFARQQAAEDDAVPLEQRPRLQLDRRLACRSRSASLSSDQRPAMLDRCPGGPADRSKADDRSQATESIRRDEARGDQIAQRRAHRRFVAARQPRRARARMTRPSRAGGRGHAGPFR